MRHDFVKFEIKNAVIIFAQNAKKSCCNKKDVKLYKIWVAARKSDLQPVLETAFNEEERDGRDALEFCQTVPASVKVKRNLRLTGYDNPDEFYTFYVLKWNEPIDITEDYAVPFIIILISLNEGAGIVSSLVISLSCIFSFYLLGVIIFALRRRFRLFGQEQGFKSITYLLISIAIIFIALFSWNASWFTIGLNQ